MSKFDTYARDLEVAREAMALNRQKKDDAARAFLNNFVDRNLIGSALLQDLGIQVRKDNHTYLLTKGTGSVEVMVEGDAIRVYRQDNPSQGGAFPLYGRNGKLADDFEDMASDLILRILTENGMMK